MKNTSPRQTGAFHTAFSTSNSKRREFYGMEAFLSAPPPALALAAASRSSALAPPRARGSFQEQRPWPRPVCAQQQPGKSASLAPSPAPTAGIHDDEGGDDLRHFVPCAYGRHRLMSPSPFHKPARANRRNNMQKPGHSSDLGYNRLHIVSLIRSAMTDGRHTNTRERIS